MDLQRLKQLSEAKTKAGTITKQVRATLREYKHDKQDLQQGLSETFCHDIQRYNYISLLPSNTRYMGSVVLQETMCFSLMADFVSFCCVY